MLYLQHENTQSAAATTQRSTDHRKDMTSLNTQLANARELASSMSTNAVLHRTAANAYADELKSLVSECVIAEEGPGEKCSSRMGGLAASSTHLQTSLTGLVTKTAAAASKGLYTQVPAPTLEERKVDDDLRQTHSMSRRGRRKYHNAGLHAAPGAQAAANQGAAPVDNGAVSGVTGHD